MFSTDPNNSLGRIPKCVKCNSSSIHMKGINLREAEISIDEDNQFYIEEEPLDILDLFYHCNECNNDWTLELIEDTGTTHE